MVARASCAFHQDTRFADVERYVTNSIPHSNYDPLFRFFAHGTDPQSITLDLYLDGLYTPAA